MGLLLTDIQTQQRKKLFLIFQYFSLFFFNRLNIIRSGQQKYGIEREFQDLLENGPTSNRYSNLATKIVHSDTSA